MTRVPAHRRGLARGARLGLIGLALGAVAGVAAAGDIKSSFPGGRIAPAAAAARQEAAPTDPHRGFELAAQLGLSEREDCRTLEPQLRHGCLDYVARRGPIGFDPLDAPF